MDHLGTDFNNTGSVMSRTEHEEVRRKRGECVTCGRKCFRKKLFKMVPMDEHGKVVNGRCLNCHPLDSRDLGDGAGLPAVSRKATREDLERFTRSQSNLSNRNLMTSGAGFSSSSRRPAPPRSMSSLSRSDNRSVGSSSTSSRPQLGRRSASLMPSSSSAVPPSPSETTRVASLQSHASESQALPLPPQPSRSMPPPSRPSQPSRSTPVNGSPGLNGSHHSQEASYKSASRERNSLGRRRPLTASRSDVALAARALDHPVPTVEELQRAAMTILAAKKHGMYEDVLQPDEMQGLNDHLEQLSTEHNLHESYDQDYIAGNRAGSGRSIRSASTLGDPIDEIDGFDIPSHGVLNRGGAFPQSPPNGESRRDRQLGPHIVSGSSRTLSSMSSIEEEIHQINNVYPSSIPRGKAVEALYEESEDCNRSVLSQASRASSGRSVRSQHIIDGEPLSEEQYVDKIRRLGPNFGEVLIVLREAMESPVVVREGLEELAHLQLNPEDHDMLADMAAPHVIVDAMQAHESSLQVQLWGCGAIWNMSGTLRNQLVFVDADALLVILAAMDRFIDHVDLQEKAIATLSNLGAAQDNLPILIDKGAIERIVEAMNKHSEVSSVQVKGCSAVTNLASHDSPMKQRLMEFGAGGAVVIAMVMHPEDFYLQEKALRALRNLCANSEQNKVELANIGGIDAVISAMQVHRDEAGVQEEGAWTLSNLAGDDENKAVIGDCGGIDVVIRAMWVHSDNVGVQDWCCRALFTLTLDAQNGNVVLEVGGISAVVNAMQAHVDSPTVQEMGCAVLGNLAGTDQSRMRIVDEEALDAIVLAMVLHSDDMQVQERACMVLLQLAIAANCKSMIAANIPELVRVAAQKFPERCQEPADRLINTLDGMS